MNITSIEWCHGLTAEYQGKTVERKGYTWNPTRGCSRVSPGCEHCYAEAIAGRLSGPGSAFEGYATSGSPGPRWTRKVDLLPGKLADPMKVRHPAAVFVNSMSDLFHEELSFEEIAAVVGVVAACPQHLMMTLTKRATRQRQWFEWLKDWGGPPYCTGPVGTCLHFAQKHCDHKELRDARTILSREWPLANWRIGVSAENQEMWDERVPELMRCPASFRFVSAEPLLSRIDVEQGSEIRGGVGGSLNPLSGDWWATTGDPAEDYASKEAGPKIDQIIVGGESGPGARPCRFEWVESIVEQCRSAATSCFVKQGGSNAFWQELGGMSLRWPMKDKKGGSPAEWPGSPGLFPREVV